MADMVVFQRARNEEQREARRHAILGTAAAPAKGIARMIRPVQNGFQVAVGVNLR